MANLMTERAWREIMDAAQMADDLVSLPVVVQQKDPGQDTDSLYGETKDEATDWVTYAAMQGVVREKPSAEYLTARGLLAGADVLVWFDGATVLEWELVNALTFTPTEVMRMQFNGLTLNITQATPQRFPTADAGLVLFGWLVVGQVKPR